jgi:beta-glucosidase
VQSRIDDIVNALTLDEKAALCSGRDFWSLESLPDHGVPATLMTDGPHGLRKQSGSNDMIGLHLSEPATCFPTAAALASSWNTSLLHEIGAAIGAECRDEGVGVLLGPGANIKRSPLCGRNFEYYSEDPFLSGHLAAGFINGVQQNGVLACLKHFAANNQERRRMVIDVLVDERALREIYLAGFEIAVTRSQPGLVMCAYNRLNGVYCSEHAQLLTSILRDEWGFRGFVVSDWGATNDRVKGLTAGLDVEMPSSGGSNDRQIADAVRSGSLPEETLNRTVRRILAAILPVHDTPAVSAPHDPDVHHELARQSCNRVSGAAEEQRNPAAQYGRADRGGGGICEAPQIPGKRQQPRQPHPDGHSLGGTPASA